MSRLILALGLLASVASARPLDTPYLTLAKPHAEVGSIPTIEIVPGVHMPMSGIGTWQYNDTQAEAAVTLALSLGHRINIDTADIYANQVGVGAAIKKSGLPRDAFFVTTKIAGGLNDTATTAAVDGCLKDLGLDYVDLLLIHFPDFWNGKGGPDLRKSEWLQLEKEMAAGKTKALGVSHYCEHHLLDVLEVSSVPVAVNQVEYHVGMGTAGPNATDSAMFDKLVGIQRQSFSPLCGPCNDTELITGNFTNGIGKKYGKTGAQVALKWIVQQGIPVIPKSDNIKHIKENLDLFDWKLSDEDFKALTNAKSPPVFGGGDGKVSGDCATP
mmetsp:Transcript_22295/g.26819  ORF Transcript_22295/g.26819 Transcript_22295/m.26819 type:complete len:328 (+) Transcript_22295:104-1087(+)|eukprot:CAMPEP_0197854790 /NCGR_PEP_ID=MMETSP1438-20131217/25334_1 /TAXON_ID=1461541 /ORGANISM="Pterosperma sp., Strain CCMP1384" /LENGTH=327 /DNA_ID=CAMNT_0043469655 /DNA_START=104 /DNA_END=1087 /DNA_ORIENTATION=+